MELQQNWKAFQSVFQTYQQKFQSDSHLGEGAAEHWKAVVDGDRVILLCSEKGCFPEYSGYLRTDLPIAILESQVHWIEWRNVRGLFSKLDQEKHFVDELAAFQKGLELETVRKPHFLFSLLGGVFKRVMPNSFGIFIRLEGQRERDLLLLIQRGRLEAFLEPNVCFLGHKAREPEEVVKALAERHLVPILGVVAPYWEWTEWSHQDSPWKSIFTAVRKRRLKLIPFRWDVFFLLWWKSRGVSVSNP